MDNTFRCDKFMLSVVYFIWKVFCEPVVPLHFVMLQVTWIAVSIVPSFRLLSGPGSAMMRWTRNVLSSRHSWFQELMQDILQFQPICISWSAWPTSRGGDSRVLSLIRGLWQCQDLLFRILLEIQHISDCTPLCALPSIEIKSCGCTIGIVGKMCLSSEPCVAASQCSTRHPC